jgi:hypothetical protein
LYELFLAAKENHTKGKEDEKMSWPKTVKCHVYLFKEVVEIPEVLCQN